MFSHTTYQQLWIECEKEQCALLLLLLLLLSCDSEAHFHIPIRIVFLLFLISIRIDVCVCVCVLSCAVLVNCNGHAMGIANCVYIAERSYQRDSLDLDLGNQLFEGMRVIPETVCFYFS